ncbi:MAG: carbohydrate binding domain-containing protein [Nocardioides sp.]
MTAPRRQQHRPARPHIWARLTRAVLGVALLAGTVLPALLASPARADVTLELMQNGGFETGTAGWRTNRKRQLYDATRPAHSGTYSARLKMAVKGRMVFRTKDPVVATADTLATYTLTAFVRATRNPVSGRLRVREMAGGQRVKQHTVAFNATGSWKRVRLTFSPTTSNGLTVAVVGRKMATRGALLVDDVSLTQTSTIQPPPPGSCVADSMGIPPAGLTYLGAAVNGTSDLGTREGELGHRLALHRTYFQAGQINGAVNQAKADLALGRLPWISFKEPLSWSEMAAGDGNAWVEQLGDALATVPGPVWLAVHHEPEGDGDMSQWVAMQQQIAPIIHARTDNVAFSVIYSGWNTYGNDTDTVASKWPGDDNIDILAIDAYNDFGVTRNGRTGTRHLDLSEYFQKMAAWSAAHGTAWALGETGQSDQAALDRPGWIADSYQQMVALGGAGFSYYDSSANSVADWTLDEQHKFSAFQSQQPNSAQLCS